MNRFLLNSSQVMCPPSSVGTPMTLDERSPLISLCGSANGISVTQTWHTHIFMILKRLGYRGNIYIPLRLNANPQDHTAENKQYEQENNRRAFAQSNCIVYWEESSRHTSLLGYTAALLRQGQILRASLEEDKRFVLFGSSNSQELTESLRLLSSQIVVYSTLKGLCDQIYIKIPEGFSET